MRYKSLYVFLPVFCLFLGACSTSQAAQSSPNFDQGTYSTGTPLSESSAGRMYTGFTFEIQTDGEPVGLLLRGTTTTGKIYMLITNAVSGEVAWKSDPVGGAAFKDATLITNLQAGSYVLRAAWDAAVSGTYDIYLVPGEAVRLPQVQVTALLPGLGMVLVALGYSGYARRRRLGWGYFVLGGLAWVAAAALRLGFAWLVNPTVFMALTGLFGEGAGLTLFNLYAGALTGIFEVLLVWLAARTTRLGKATWDQTLAFGIGIGVIETLLLGLGSLYSSLSALLAPNLASLDLLRQAAQANNLGFGLAGPVARLFIILVHIAAVALVFQAAAQRNAGLFWIAFAYKSLIDAVVSAVQVGGLDGTQAIWGVEAVIAVWGAAGVVITLWVKNHTVKNNPLRSFLRPRD